MFKLMLVDDEQHDRQAMKIMLAGNSRYQIIAEAENGQQAIERALELEPDIILMDIKMPKIDGLEAARRIKQAKSGIQIIMLSAYDEFDYAKQALEQDAGGYILKPVTSEELFAILDKTVQKLQQRNSLLGDLERFKQELEANLDGARTRFCSQLLLGKNLKEEELQEHAALLKLEPFPDTVVVIQPQLVQESYLVQELMLKQISAIIKSFLEEKYIWQLLTTDVVSFNRLLVLLPVGTQNYSQLVSFLTEVLQHTATELNLVLKAGIGDSFQQLSSLSKSYEQALIALANPSDSLVLCYQDIKNIEADSSYSLYLEQQLILSLQAGNTEGFFKLLDEILQHAAVRSRVNIDLGRAIVSELLFKVYRAVGESGENKSFSEQIKRTEKLLEVQSWGELAAFLRSEALELTKWVTSKYNMRHKKLVEKAKSYIEKYYSQEISLDRIGDFLCISPGYFSSIFKEVEGIAFSEYLLRYRVSAAQKLLLDPSVNIAEAGYRVGFNDPAYFSRTFKRIVGVSPSSYRSFGAGK